MQLEPEMSAPRSNTVRHGAAMRRALLMVVLPLVAGCPPPYVPCGWDESFETGGSYGVGLIEAYGPDITTARYTSTLEIDAPPSEPLPPCGDIDELDVGDVLVVRTRFPPGTFCGTWLGVEITEPALAIEPTLTGLVFSDRGYNMLVSHGTRDLGGGCTGVWELLVHSEGTDPFVAQDPLAEPVVMVYRTFIADNDAVDACYEVLGVDRATVDYPQCGDAFVAAMDRR